MKNMELANTIRNNKQLDDALESFDSFVINSPEGTVNYVKEAIHLNKLLAALENAKVIKIL